MSTRINLFLASSRDLVEERATFESFVRQRNDSWTQQGRYLKLISSDDFPKALAPGRSQNEYNEAIRRSEIMVVLFSTKVGEYTREEFEVALAEYRKTHDRPRIFLFWNVAQVSLASVNRAELYSLFDFQQRLSEANLYWIEYRNTDELIRLFGDQLERYFPLAPSPAKGTSLAEVTRLTLSIDGLLLEAIRDLQHQTPARRVRIYQSLLHGALVEQGLAVRDFFPGYLRERARQLAQVAADRVDLTIDVSPNLERLTYRTQDFEIVIDKPVLMWNCHCGVLVGRRFGDDASGASLAAKCPIHRDPNGTVLTEIYKTGVILTNYDDHRVIWQRSREVWPPTVDSFVMCRNLMEDGVLTYDYRSVLDLGCGTGFIGLYLGYRNPGVREIRLADWLLTPLLYSMMSWELDARRHPNKTIEPLLGLNTSWLASDRRVGDVDVCVCNPPYLPSFDEFPEIKLHHTVGGTDLLEHVIERSTDIARETYINFSDMALPEAEAAADRSGKTLREIGEPYDVPFTVPQAFLCDGYVDRLAADDRIFTKDEGGYQWWHRIRTYRVEKR
jgi:hypothetical protein